MRFLIALVYLLIVYGSLFPFNFSLTEFYQQYPKLLNFNIFSRGDVVANILLYIPLGLLYSLHYNLKENKLNANVSMSAFLIVFIFSVILQIIQIALPSRDQNILDAIFNMVGFIAGIYASRYLHIPKKYLFPKLSYLPYAVALTFILSELSPFIPTLDYQEIKNSFKFILVAPTVSAISELLYTFIMWVLVIRLLMFEQKKAPFKVLLAVWLFMIAAKVFIYNNHLNYIDFIAPVLAIAFAFCVDLNKPSLSKGILFCSVIAFIFSNLSALGAFNSSVDFLIPFYSYLNGNLYAGIQGGIFNVFFFSAMLWLGLELGWPMKKTAVTLSVLVFSIEFIQLFMPARVTDFADIIFVFLAYIIMRNLGDYLATVENEYQGDKNNLIGKNRREINSIWLTPWQKFSLYCLVSFVVFFALVTFILNLPGLPYNIAELFENKGSLLNLLFFFLFLHGIGGASYFIQMRTSKYVNLEAAKIVGLHLLTLAILFVLLWGAVTTESIQDIVGASKLKQFIYANQASQSVLMMYIKVFSISSLAKTAEFIDFLVRFSALFGLIQIPLTFWLVAMNKETRLKCLLGQAIISVLLLTLFFQIVFTYAITDNVTELITSPLALVFIIMFITFSIALSIKLVLKGKTGLFLLLTITSSVLTWPLTGIIFEQSIIKYGYTFTALDFLIGVGREHTLPAQSLAFRWVALVIFFQWLMVLGAFTANKIPAFVIKQKSLRSYTKLLSIFVGLLIIIYIGNRLFGSSMQWQTINQYYFSKDSFDFSEDTSKAKINQASIPGNIYLNGQQVEDLAVAMKKAKDFDVIRISAGLYQQAGVLMANNVRIIAEPGAAVYGATKAGKGALVIKGDNTYIEGLECHSIYVPGNNGVCIRLEGRGITLNKVYFHHAQGGLLGSRKGGDIHINNSRFEHLGDGAFYHGIYTLKETRLYIDNSYFLNNRNGGHEIKSRSFHTEITNSVIASSESKDSRLIDVPNGGVLIIKNNILIEGPFSENHDLLSWGVEGIIHKAETILIQDNLIISDKKSARLISFNRKPNDVKILDNIVVGDISAIPEEDNIFFDKRSELSIAPAPFIPRLDKNNTLPSKSLSKNGSPSSQD
jgi:VanZ family protein